MNENTLSLIRHILTALGTVLTLIGLNKYTGIVDYVLQNLDTVVASVMGVVGFFVTLFGFFKNKDRFVVREELKTLKK